MVAPIKSGPVSVPQYSSQSTASPSTQAPSTAAPGYSSASSFQAATAAPQEDAALPQIKTTDDLSQMLDDMLKGGNAGKAWLTGHGMTLQASRGRITKLKGDLDAWIKANPKATDEQKAAKVKELQQKLSSGGFIDKMISDMIDAGVKAANQHVSMGDGGW